MLHHVKRLSGGVWKEGMHLCVDLRLVRQAGGEVIDRDLIPVSVPELCCYRSCLLD